MNTATWRNMAPTLTPVTVADVAEALAAHQYLADEGLATAIFLALRLRRPLLLEGEAGRGQDRGGQGAGRAGPAAS